LGAKISAQQILPFAAARLARRVAGAKLKVAALGAISMAIKP